MRKTEKAILQEYTTCNNTHPQRVTRTFMNAQTSTQKNEVSTSKTSKPKLKFRRAAMLMKAMQKKVLYSPTPPLYVSLHDAN